MDQQYEDFKKQVKDSSDIVDVIGGYISLQKKGRYYWACCPFHGEKTPSFSVDKERQFFYCYGCHTGGDVFTFVQKIENSTFPEAVKSLAARANIPIPESHRTAADVCTGLTIWPVVTFLRACTKQNPARQRWNIFITEGLPIRLLNVSPWAFPSRLLMRCRRTWLKKAVRRNSLPLQG